MMAEEAKIMQDAARRVRVLLIFLFMSFFGWLVEGDFLLKFTCKKFTRF